MRSSCKSLSALSQLKDSLERQSSEDTIAWGKIAYLSKDHDFRHRAWIFQKFILAQDLIIFHGYKTVNLEAIQLWVDYSREVYRNDTHLVLPPMELRYIESLVDLRKSMDRKSYSLSSLLESTINLGANDLKDKVYALFGLAAQNRIKADYNKSVEQIYSEAARVFVHERNNLKILVFRELLSSSPESSFNLPSWVPSWHDIAEHESNLEQLTRWIARYEASKSREAIIRTDSQSFKLWATGIECDAIEDLLGQIYGSESGLEDMVRPYTLALSKRFKGDKYPTGISMKHAYVRLVVNDIDVTSCSHNRIRPWITEEAYSKLVKLFHSHQWITDLSRMTGPFLIHRDEPRFLFPEHLVPDEDSLLVIRGRLGLIEQLPQHFKHLESQT
jgi:hypothetical protein